MGDVFYVCTCNYDGIRQDTTMRILCLQREQKGDLEGSQQEMQNGVDGISDAMKAYPEGKRKKRIYQGREPAPLPAMFTSPDG